VELYHIKEGMAFNPVP